MRELKRRATSLSREADDTHAKVESLTRWRYQKPRATFARFSRDEIIPR